MKLRNMVWAGFALVALFLTSLVPAWCAPPVRIAIIPGGGSGMEQEVVDGIQSQLESNSNVKLSTVNPDWFVVCNIIDRVDINSQSVRVNGTVTIKTGDGQVIDTISTQANKQDFSLTPGTPVNKTLQDNAVREVVRSLVERATVPIQNAVDIEIQTRDKVIAAYGLADQDKYNEAIQILTAITPDSPQFKKVRSVIAEFAMEQDALDAIKQADSLSRAGRYSQAISVLRSVDKKSKRYRLALSKISSCQAVLRRRSGGAVAKKNKPAGQDLTQQQLKAFEAQKKALDAQRKAIEAQEAALKARGK